MKDTTKRVLIWTTSPLIIWALITLGIILYFTIFTAPPETYSDEIAGYIFVAWIYILFWAGVIASAIGLIISLIINKIKSKK